jgi:hypothetical protein
MANAWLPLVISPSRCAATAPSFRRGGQPPHPRLHGERRRRPNAFADSAIDIGLTAEAPNLDFSNMGSASGLRI